MSNPLKVESLASVPKLMNVSPSRSSRPMDPKEAAEYLKLTERTIKDWARKGYIPGHPLGEGKRRIWRFRVARNDRQRTQFAGYSIPQTALIMKAGEIGRLEELP